MSHTPGPWHRNIKPASKYSVIFAGDNTHIAAVKSQGLSAEEVEANADLIAAAPKMLAALESLFKECTMMHSRYGEFCNQKEADAAIKAGLDAIAEAKGE